MAGPVSSTGYDVPRQQIHPHYPRRISLDQIGHEPLPPDTVRYVEIYLRAFLSIGTRGDVFGNLPEAQRRGIGLF